MTLLGVAAVVVLVASVTVAAAVDDGGTGAPAGQVLGQPSGEAESLGAAVDARLLTRTLLQELREAGEADVIVSFAAGETIVEALQGPGAQDLAAAIGSLRDRLDEAKDAALRALPGAFEVVEDYPYLPAVHIRVRSELTLLALVNVPGVLGVSAPVFSTFAVEQSLGVIRAREAAGEGHTAEGTYVAVLDTGIDYRRGAFGTCRVPGDACRVAIARDYPSGTDDGQFDSDGHGTNVAGIVAAVAPETRLISMDVFDGGEEGQPTSSTMAQLAALNDLVELRADGLEIRALNMSLGAHGTFFPTDCRFDPNGATNPMAGPFAEVRALGILPVVAAGNDGGSGRIGVSYPACTPGAVSVGAVYDAPLGQQFWGECQDAATTDAVTCFSQVGPNLTLFAPGACITAAGIPEGGGCYGGTSQAAPHVAGAAAVLAAFRPEATPDQVELSLAGGGPILPHARARGKRRLDVMGSLSALGAGNEGVDVDPPTVTRPVAESQDDTDPNAPSTDVMVTWTGDDEGGSGISSYSLWVSVDAGLWNRVPLASALQESAPQTFVRGSQYLYAVRAFDGAGNQSAWAFSPLYSLR